MRVRILIAIAAISGVWASAEAKSDPGVEVQMIVTSADHVTHRPLAVTLGDLKITDATITAVTPIAKGRDLELFILIDNSASYEFGGKLQELRRFANSQPPTVAIGVAFVREGTLDVVEKPTTDHQRVARALRAPSGSIAASPYCALSSLIAFWQYNDSKNKSLRREIVLVSAGIDDTATGPVCDNAETTIQDAERAGVVVYALYNPVAGYAAEKWSKVDSGIVDLAHVACETGGEAYFTGHTPAKTYEPFLSDIAEHLANQYLVKFKLTPGPYSSFQHLDVTSKIPWLELMKPEKIWVRPPVAASEY